MKSQPKREKRHGDLAHIPTIDAFNFEIEPANVELIRSAWISEIEQAALSYLSDNRMISFLTAAMRLGSQSKNPSHINLFELVEYAGYSRSTFFRLFENYTGFLLKSYQISCALSVRVYYDHLKPKQLNLEDFCNFTATVFYGANCTIPNEILKMLWQEHNKSHAEFHPHLSKLTKYMHNYLQNNPQTQHLKIDIRELQGLIKNLDLIILNARLENDEQWGTPFYFVKLRKMLHGYFLSHASKAKTYGI